MLIEPPIAERAYRPPLEPGNHGKVAERYRVETIAQIKLLQVFAAAMEDVLRSEPDNDAQFEVYSKAFMDAVTLSGNMLEAFRKTRDCAAEG